ncbi:MAG: hypothetical protein ACREIB_06380 [Pseudomonadota bacterium]
MKLIHGQDVLGFTPARRIGLGIAGAAAGLAVCSLVLAMFADASSSRWLPSSPEAIAQIENCRQRPQRPARDACVRQVVAQWQAAEQTVLASRP